MATVVQLREDMYGLQILRAFRIDKLFWALLFLIADFRADSCCSFGKNDISTFVLIKALKFSTRSWSEIYCSNRLLDVGKNWNDKFSSNLTKFLAGCSNRTQNFLVPRKGQAQGLVVI